MDHCRENLEDENGMARETWIVVAWIIRLHLEQEEELFVLKIVKEIISTQMKPPVLQWNRREMFPEGQHTKADRAVISEGRTVSEAGSRTW